MFQDISLQSVSLINIDPCKLYVNLSSLFYGEIMCSYMQCLHQLYGDNVSEGFTLQYLKSFSLKL